MSKTVGAMRPIDLTYVESGIHDRLVAHVADQQDYYAEEGVHVCLRTGCDWPIDRVRQTATVGQGRAVLSRIADGIPWTVLSVSTERPVFWLMAQERFLGVEDLRGYRVGVQPPSTAPGCFCRMVLRKHGLDPDHSIRPVVLTPGDDRRHLYRLADGSLDTCFVGSTVVPELVAQRYGLRLLALVGDHFRIPTVGVAVDPTYLSLDDPAVKALVRSHRKALSTIHGEPELAAHYVKALLPNLTEEEAVEHYKRYVATYFTLDGPPRSKGGCSSCSGDRSRTSPL
ncbi:ABC transporter substrate-binding protein [Mycolicibacter arupensis]|jgi:ABC-type nitrate/sulfonate/bicarbonate transport system substrate-binding protein|uniref:ABC transporter substrate-binding protein n=1 Tax=Mycolicibacter arupensis TaxID=342002 RepID=UPI0023F4F57E|nr:ABC transporter substrate-binding protein [Mycolicibacter arupensis]MDM2351456.1 ABC transporter substrate-binding protein [Mycobacteroides abscessus]MDM2361540.1 ABC transporter substrate-binding protein [Mycobacteroides abscessus]